MGEIDFEKPIEFTLKPHYLSVQPASGYSDLQKFGSEIKKFQNMICQPYDEWYGRFSEGDRLYIDGKAPSLDEEYNGERANFTIDDISNQNVGIRVVLKRIN